jgi:DNA-binding transcriptional LysR family regulator
LHHIDLLIVIDLERGLEVQLLVRTTRSASPTENGQA